MILACEVVIRIASNTDPGGSLRVNAGGKEAGIHCLAADFLVFMSSDVVKISHGHEFLNWLVSEDEVSVSIVVSEHALLFIKPVDSLGTDA